MRHLRGRAAAGELGPRGGGGHFETYVAAAEEAFGPPPLREAEAGPDVLEITD